VFATIIASCPSGSGSLNKSPSTTATRVPSPSGCKATAGNGAGARQLEKRCLQRRMASQHRNQERARSAADIEHTAMTAEIVTFC